MQWHQLGVDWAPRAVVSAAPLCVATLLGAGTAMAGAWLLDTGPIGVVKVVEPDPERRFSGPAC